VTLMRTPGRERARRAVTGVKGASRSGDEKGPIRRG